MNHPVNNQLVMRFRVATGLPVLLAKQQLQQLDADAQIACVLAAENRPLGIACDPIEQDEISGPIICAVIASVSERIRLEHEQRMDEIRKTDPAIADLLSTGRGLCHRLWHETKLQLKKEHGIEWRSPADMNPSTIFD